MLLWVNFFDFEQIFQFTSSFSFFLPIIMRLKLLAPNHLSGTTGAERVCWIHWTFVVNPVAGFAALLAFTRQRFPTLQRIGWPFLPFSFALGQPPLTKGILFPVANRLLLERPRNMEWPESKILSGQVLLFLSTNFSRIVHKVLVKASSFVGTWYREDWFYFMLYCAHSLCNATIDMQIFC